MRIQLCKERYMAVAEYRPTLEEIEKEILPDWKKSFSRPNVYIKNGRAYVEAYICENCGAEIYRHYCCYDKLAVGNDEKHQKFTPRGKDRIKELSQKIKAKKKEILDDFHANTMPEICPICGQPRQSELCSKRQEEWGYNLVYHGKKPEDRDEISFNFLIDGAFRDLQYEIHEKQERQLKEELENLELRLRPIGISTYIADPQEILSNREKLIEYLKSLIQTERNVASLKKRVEALYNARIINNIEVAYVNARPFIEMKKQMDADKVHFERAEKTYQRCITEVEVCKSNRPAPVKLSMPAKPAEPDYRKPGLFNKKKILAENEAMETHYQALVQAYEDECKNRLAEMERQNKHNQEQYLENIKNAESAVQAAKEEMEAFRVLPEKYTPSAPVEMCPEKAKQKMIADEIEQAETMLKKFYQLRKDMFNSGIVHNQYYQLADWLAFCNYLETGRCTSLEGVNGAYNLYEQEKRSNITINKLTGIEQSLHRIERGQAVLASQLMSMNATLNELNSTMNIACDAIMDIRTNTGNMSEYLNQISNNTEMIAYNTAVSAYYSKMNVELTNALGFMVALK